LVADWQAIEAELEALVEAEGYELIEVQRVLGRGASLTLLVDRRDEPGHITLDECAAVSRRVGQYLDVADPFRRPYRLVVSSPGLDRPLTRPSHFQRALGQQVRVRFDAGDGPRTVEARLEAAGDDGLVLATAEERLTVAWPAVAKAQLIYDWGD
jgi:ribosome maturation factor RimP